MATFQTSMEQSLQVNTHKKSKKRCRHIQKAPKRPGANPRRCLGNGYTHKKQRLVKQRQCMKKIPSVSSTEFIQQGSLQDWLLLNERSASHTMSQLQRQLPCLSSIDQLFSLTSQESLQENSDLTHLWRYSRISSLLVHPHGRVILLKHPRVGALGVYLGEQGQNKPVSCGMFLSESECGLVQKRSMFMEKLKGNEAKYANSLGRMSQISKELAFTYRSYLQARNQVFSMIQSLPRKAVPPIPIKNRAPSRYAELLITKNLNHTFSSLELDPFNYFKMREHLESGRIDEFQNITSFQELEAFIQKRKPKRGRRLGLSTACSICLSDYYELSNPLKMCSVCGLRAHKLCCCFDHMRCGYCAYQKLERPMKEVVNWCFICRKPGLMVLKFADNYYAHGFCLLLHGLWTTTRKQFRASSEEDIEGINYQLRGESSCDCSLHLGGIEFLNPFQNQTLVTKTSNNSKSQYRLQADRMAFLSEIKEIDQELVEQIEELGNIGNKKQKEEFQGFDIQSEKNEGDACHRCGSPFFRDYFVTCQLCGHHYHGLCAFLAGFKMKIQEGWHQKSNNRVKIVCCDPQCPRIGWNRRFKLNYDRCVFSLSPSEVEGGPPLLWEQ